DARDIERADARGTDAVRLAGLPERVPHVRGRAGVDPDLVPQVAGVSGPRDVDVDAADLGAALAEVAQVGPVPTAGALEDVARARPLQGDGRELLGHVDDVYVEPGRVQREPPVAGVGRRPEELLLSPAGDGPVVDHLAVLVAPRRVGDTVD